MSDIDREWAISELSSFITATKIIRHPSPGVLQRTMQGVEKKFLARPTWSIEFLMLSFPIGSRNSLIHVPINGWGIMR